MNGVIAFNEFDYSGRARTHVSMVSDSWQVDEDERAQSEHDAAVNSC